MIEPRPFGEEGKYAHWQRPLVLKRKIDPVSFLEPEVHRRSSDAGDAVVVGVALHLFSWKQCSRLFARENFIRRRRTNDALAPHAPGIHREGQARKIFRGVDKTCTVSLGVFRLKISITEHEEVCLWFEVPAILWVVRQLQAGDRRSK